MSMRALGRDLLLVAAALAAGWWARGPNKPVLAQRGAPENLAFQMIGTGPESTLVMYDPGTRVLYVYARAGAGSSRVSCTYGFLISTPGQPLERRNCAPGEQH
jgi:hypothetical protein